MFHDLLYFLRDFLWRALSEYANGWKLSSQE